MNSHLGTYPGVNHLTAVAERPGHLLEEGGRGRNEQVDWDARFFKAKKHLVFTACSCREDHPQIAGPQG